MVEKVRVADKFELFDEYWNPKVIGEVNDSGGKIKLDGYCKFEGPLTKKQ